MLLDPEDLRQFQNHSSQMAALDYMVSLASDVFIPTYDGNMAKVVEGQRRLVFFFCYCVVAATFGSLTINMIACVLVLIGILGSGKLSRWTAENWWSFWICITTRHFLGTILHLQWDKFLRRASASQPAEELLPVSPRRKITSILTLKSAWQMQMNALCLTSQALWNKGISQIVSFRLREQACCGQPRMVRHGERQQRRHDLSAHDFLLFLCSIGLILLFIGVIILWCPVHLGWPYRCKIVARIMFEIAAGVSLPNCRC